MADIPLTIEDHLTAIQSDSTGGRFAVVPTRNHGTTAQLSPT
jgi:hypothetical protein